MEGLEASTGVARIHIGSRIDGICYISELIEPPELLRLWSSEPPELLELWSSGLGAGQLRTEDLKCWGLYIHFGATPTANQSQAFSS